MNLGSRENKINSLTSIKLLSKSISILKWVGNRMLQIKITNISQILSNANLEKTSHRLQFRFKTGLLLLSSLNCKIVSVFSIVLTIRKILKIYKTRFNKTGVRLQDLNA